MAVEIRWTITQPAMRSRRVWFHVGRGKYTLECCSVEVERSGADNERLMVWRRVVSFIGFVKLGSTTISTTHLCAEFAADISFTSVPISTTMFFVPLILSFSSSSCPVGRKCSVHDAKLHRPEPLWYKRGCTKSTSTG